MTDTVIYTLPGLPKRAHATHVGLVWAGGAEIVAFPAAGGAQA